jgi:hypothetical protein
MATSRRFWIGSGLILAIVLAIGWWLNRSDRASLIAEQAVSPAQAAIWQAASERPPAAGLARLPVRGVAGDGRASSPTASQAIPPAPVVDLAPGAATATRIVATSNLGEWRYSGSAVVEEAVRERVTLRLGDQSTLTFLARVARQPLGLALRDVVDVTVASAPGPIDRERVLAVQTSSGAVIVSALKTGGAAIRLEVRLPRSSVALPPLELTATQEGAPVNGTTAVALRVNGATETVQPGATVQIAGLSVLLVTSAARPGLGSDTTPYGVELLAWRAPGAGP